MEFRRGPWYPIAILVVVINTAGGFYAYLTGEPFHAFAHGVAAVGFGLWARYLKQTSAQRERAVAAPDKVEMLEANLSELERELWETQKRLDFADQLLKNKPRPSDSQPHD